MLLELQLVRGDPLVVRELELEFGASNTGPYLIRYAAHLGRELLLQDFTLGFLFAEVRATVSGFRSSSTGRVALTWLADAAGPLLF